MSPGADRGVVSVMRFVSGVSIVALAAGAAGAQELGAFGVGSQMWDTGDSYYRAGGFTVGLVSRPRALATRYGVRFGLDMSEHWRREVHIATNRTREVTDFKTPLRTASVSVVLLPYMTPRSRLEVSVGAAEERGRWSRGKSVIFGIGPAWQMAKLPLWTHLGYQYRLNRPRGNTDPLPLDGRPSKTRHSLRVGVLADLSVVSVF